MRHLLYVAIVLRQSGIVVPVIRFTLTFFASFRILQTMLRIVQTEYLVWFMCSSPEGMVELHIMRANMYRNMYRIAEYEKHWLYVCQK